MPSFVTAVGAALLLPGAVLGAVKPNFPAVANHALAPNFGCNIFGVNEYFSEQYPVPPQCQDYYSVQVTDLCREYLTLIRTVYTTTVTPVSTRTSSFTASTTTTTTATSISTAVSTSVSTSVSTTLTTTTSVVTQAPPPTGTGSFVQAKRVREIAAAPPAGCNGITRDRFLSHPAFMIEIACKCLPIRFTTVSTASTARNTRTVTVSSTTTLTFTRTSTTTSTTSTTTTTTTTTTTSTSTSTFAIPTPNCDVEYRFNGNTGVPADTVVIDNRPADTGSECCERCGGFPNCVAVFTFQDAAEVQCNYIVNTETRNTPTSDTCPRGFEDYDFGNPMPGGGLFQGPCGY